MDNTSSVVIKVMEAVRVLVLLVRLCFKHKEISCFRYHDDELNPHFFKTDDNLIYL